MDELTLNIMRGVEHLTALLARLASGDGAEAGAARVAAEGLYGLADVLAGVLPDDADLTST